MPKHIEINITEALKKHELIERVKAQLEEKLTDFIDTPHTVTINANGKSRVESSEKTKAHDK